MSTRRKQMSLTQVALFVIAKALALTAAMTCIGFMVIAFVQDVHQHDHLVTKLQQNTTSNLSVLIPTYLLPEQEPARAMIMEHIRNQEQLDAVSALPLDHDGVPGHPDCTPDPQTTVHCRSSSSPQLVSVVIPIHDSELTHGYLVKSRKLHSVFTQEHFQEIAILVGLVLLTTFATLALLFNKLIKVEIRGALRQMIGWTQGRLRDPNNSEPMDTPYTEVALLSEEIDRLIADNRCLQAQQAFAETASLVAHDMQSPLSSLKSALRYLQQLAVETPHYADYLNLLELSATRLTGIAEDLLSHRLQRGDDHDEAFSVHQVLDTLVGEYSGRDVCAETIFTKQYYETDLLLHGNATSLQRALGNIVKNALEAMQGKGEITLTTTQANNAIEITIADNGPGMSSAILQKLLTGGYQPGTPGAPGMGMQVVRETTAAFGGTLTGEATLGGGSSFTLQLPLPAEELLKESPTDVVLTVANGAPILVVDDEPSMREQWRLLLSSAGYQPKPFEHLEALMGDAICGDLPESAVVDYHFDNSEHNGIDVVRWLKKHGVAHIHLCTAEYWKPHIQHLATDLGVTLCPKPLPNIVFAAPEGTATTTPTSEPVTVATSDAPPVAAGTEEDVRALVIDDDDGVRLVWTLEKARLGLADVACYDSMEACEAAAPEYASYDYAFVDKNIPESAWGLGQVITHLKNMGVRRVVVASGEKREDLLKDPECREADAIVSQKIPDELP